MRCESTLIIGRDEGRMRERRERRGKFLSTNVPPFVARHGKVSNKVSFPGDRIRAIEYRSRARNERGVEGVHEEHHDSSQSSHWLEGITLHFHCSLCTPCALLLIFHRDAAYLACEQHPPRDQPRDAQSLLELLSELETPSEGWT